MKRIFSCLLSASILGLCIFAANLSFADQSNPRIVIDSLRCEYLNNPLGIDETAPRLSWMVKSTQSVQKQTAYQILVASNPQLLIEDAGDLWDSGIVNSDQCVNVIYAGKELPSRQVCYWKVRIKDQSGRFSDWSDAAKWTMGLLSKNDWKADWISFRDKRSIQASQKTMELPPARYYRKPFHTDKSIQRAMFYSNALGIYELHLNGERIGDQMFTPGWSDYRRRVYYNAFDVTNQVRHGGNALGAIVADGWYSGYLGYGLLVGYGPNRCGRYIYSKTPALMAQLEIEYTDGSKEIVKTDPSWRVSTGPILQADMLMGETYDARLEQKDWSAPGYDDGAWNPVVLAKENGSAKMTFYDQAGEREVELGFVEPPIIQAYPSVPIRPTEEIRPVKITEPERGTYIFNLGQNFSGVVRLRVRGPRGTKVQIRHGEMLHQDGCLMTENLRKAQATDVYILRGGGDYETWTPRFTYHGFQYVELTGLAEEPSLDAVTGVAIHSDAPMVSSFECSDSMVNQLFQNVTWTQRANFFEAPTDCPQRDERFG
ncbi:MAG: family 78 glycoside hydrolase catalytic domain, partial [Candidatus Omnitrophica bacterium]|nr:family 78 glycoside hydrolase catalytic domain [Candidatus Omnitrophota bacterium]